MPISHHQSGAELPTWQPPFHDHKESGAERTRRRTNLVRSVRDIAVSVK
jgi:hypothetical protein